MNVKQILQVLLILSLMSLPLSADMSFSLGGVSCTTTQGAAGLCTPYAAATQISFDGLSGLSLPQTFGLATYSTSGSGSPFVNGSVGGQYAAPPGDQTDYLTVGSPSRPAEVDIHFSQAMYYFGLYLGSPDTYNHIRFQFIDGGGTVLRTFSGDQLSPVNHGSQSVGVYVNFYQNAPAQGFTDIVMTSTSPAFETDNHAYSTSPVPDGGTTASLLGMALAIGGLVSRRRMK